MQYISNGPDIPDALLHAHEEGKVVFFCGAGISYPAGLLNFEGLVCSVYKNLKLKMSNQEKTACDTAQYDTALNLLEKHIAGGRKNIVTAIANSLNPNFKKKNSKRTHEALLTLSKSRDGKTRLITTNFDRIFEDIIPHQDSHINVYQAPFLPVPKDTWDGIAYLHGLLDENKTSKERPDNLVVTSGDFGKAYLTERWAARFISELFRNYTVCFVGYSLNDPILRYMMDALAADKMIEGNRPDTYAFADYSNNSDKKNVCDEWDAKGIIPILYDSTNDKAHTFFHDTLHTWANEYRDGSTGKRYLVAQYAHLQPAKHTKEDNYVGRMIWALSDKTGLPAKHFADHHPIPPIEWLEEFSKERFGIKDLPRFGVSFDQNFEPKPEEIKFKFSLISRPSPSYKAPYMSLFGASAWQGSKNDNVMNHLGRWLAKHLDKKEALFWVVKHGSNLNPGFKSHLMDSLKETTKLKKNMRKLWEIVILGYTASGGDDDRLYSWKDSFEKHGNTLIVRQEFKNALRPKLKISPPYSLPTDNSSGKSEHISEIANVEFKLNTIHVHSEYYNIKRIVGFNDFLPYILTDMSELLLETLDLMCEVGISKKMKDYSYIHIPSISDHDQNRDNYDWTLLVTLCRDAWLATAEINDDKAKAILTLWASSQHPIFLRLVFFALAQKPNLVSSDTIFSWLLSHEGHWLWSLSTQREVMRLLVSLSEFLAEDDIQYLQGEILKGPPRTNFSNEISDEKFQKHSERMRWLRLKKLLQNDRNATKNTEIFISTAEMNNPNWKIESDESDEFPIWFSDTDEQPVEKLPENVKGLVRWLTDNPNPDAFSPQYGWPDRCRENFNHASEALKILAEKDKWIPGRWAEALQAWSTDELRSHSWEFAAPLVVKMPDDDFNKSIHAISWWLSDVSKNFKNYENHFFEIIDKIIKLGSDNSQDFSIDHAINHPVGRATDSLLNWWFSTKPQDNKGLPVEIANRLEQLCESKETSGMGAIILAGYLIPLYRVDQKWTKTHLIKQFYWTNKNAAAMWGSLLHAPRIYPPLLKELRTSFLSTSRNFGKLDEKYHEQYISFLTNITLSEISVFSSKELKEIFSNIDKKYLENVAKTLYQALSNTGDQKTEYLKNRIIPFIDNYWPRDKSKQTPKASIHFSEICAISGKSFNEIFDKVKDYLKPTSNTYFLSLLNNNIVQEHPQELLELLCLTIQEVPDFAKTDLKDLLNEIIRQGDQNLSLTPCFTRLDVYTIS